MSDIIYICRIMAYYYLLPYKHQEFRGSSGVTTEATRQSLSKWIEVPRRSEINITFHHLTAPICLLSSPTTYEVPLTFASSSPYTYLAACDLHVPRTASFSRVSRIVYLRTEALVCRCRRRHQ